MRHFLANIATYSIAIFLLIGAGVFAWVRSAQVTITTESAVLAQYQPEQGAIFRWHALGAGSYERNCMNCHLADGTGWDQYPGLGHTGELYTAEGGRDFVIDLHLYGLASPRWRAPMPPMGHLRDVEMAAVINYVLSNFGNQQHVGDEELLRPEDVAARRGLDLSPSDVNRQRPAR
jgi:mono/diheme cytochrome c family protein